MARLLGAIRARGLGSFRVPARRVGSGNLTRTPESNEAAAQFSRDGRRFLFRRLPVGEPIDGNHYGAQGELVLAGSDGSTPTVLGQGGEYPWASWSPDGKQVACLSVKGISIVDVATGQVVHKLPRQGFFQQLTWSPDGRWLSGVSNSFGASWSVALIEIATGKANAVSGADCCTPDWFPDSRRLVFSNRPAGQSENHGNGWTQLWMADADGRNRRLVYGEDGRHIYGGQVSPDGKYVVFTENVQEIGDPRHAGARWDCCAWRMHRSSVAKAVSSVSCIRRRNADRFWFFPRDGSLAGRTPRFSPRRP